MDEYESTFPTSLCETRPKDAVRPTRTPFYPSTPPPKQDELRHKAKRPLKVFLVVNVTVLREMGAKK